MISSTIQTHDLTRRFGESIAVDRLELSVSQGEIFGLVGPNGAGKTTTIKMLTTLLPPTSGGASVAGFDIVREAHLVRRAIGYVPQLLSADGELTGFENLLLSARLYHLPASERRSRITDALDFMGLAEVGDRLVSGYSGGMIRRLELAQAMLHHPTVLFLDEPTVGLDPTARESVWEHVRDLGQREGRTILLTTHYMDEADELCDRLAVMHLGRVAEYALITCAVRRSGWWCHSLRIRSHRAVRTGAGCADDRQVLAHVSLTDADGSLVTHVMWVDHDDDRLTDLRAT